MKFHLFFLWWMHGSEKCNDYQYNLVALAWFVLRCPQFHPPLLLQIQDNHEIQKHFPNALNISTLVFTPKHTCKKSLIINWCCYQWNTSKTESPAMSGNWCFCKSKVHFRRWDINSVMFAAKTLIHWANESLESGAHMTSFTDFSSSRHWGMSRVSGFISLSTIVQLLQPMLYNNLFCKMLQWLFMSSLKSCNKWSLAFKEQIMSTFKIFFIFL